MPLLYFVDVVTERLKVRREAQESKRQVEDVKQEAECGSVNTAEGAAEVTSPLDNGEHRDGQPMDGAGSHGKKDDVECKVRSRLTACGN